MTEDTAPGWFIWLVLAPMPASMVLMWLLSSKIGFKLTESWLPEDGHRVHSVFQNMFIGAGIITGLLLWYGAERWG